MLGRLTFNFKTICNFFFFLCQTFLWPWKRVKVMKTSRKVYKAQQRLSPHRFSKASLKVTQHLRNANTKFLQSNPPPTIHSLHVRKNNTTYIGYFCRQQYPKRLHGLFGGINFASTGVLVLGDWSRQCHGHMVQEALFPRLGPTRNKSIRRLETEQTPLLL